MKLNESIPPVEGVSPMAYRQPIGTNAEDRTSPLVLPPKTSLEVFRQFMQRIEDIVGTENATVVSSDDELQHEDYKDPSKAHDVGRRSAPNENVSFDRRETDPEASDVPRPTQGTFRQLGRRSSPRHPRSTGNHAPLQRVRDPGLAFQHWAERRLRWRCAPRAWQHWP
jgi:hypothetical protein